MTRLLDRLTEETRALHKEAETEADTLLADTTIAAYRRFLGRWYGFIGPVERSLLDVPGLDRVLDPRRLRKHLLLEHDLQALGVKPPEMKALPQCMSVPLFDDLRDALGWAFVIERSTLSHPNVFRHLAAAMPGEAAFGSSFLKCYFGSVGEMWRSFGDGLASGAPAAEDAERIVDAAKAGYRHFRRWRHTLDGKSLSVGGDVAEGSSST
jgi:heme oxygenase (biliverdin-IX-beta and delta-forming)